MGCIPVCERFLKLKRGAGTFTGNTFTGNTRQCPVYSPTFSLCFISFSILFVHFQFDPPWAFDTGEEFHSSSSILGSDVTAQKLRARRCHHLLQVSSARHAAASALAVVADDQFSLTQDRNQTLNYLPAQHRIISPAAYGQK